MGFKERLNKGKILQEYLENFLKENYIPYAKTGYENLISEYNFSNITFNKDATSEFIRFYPDYATVFKGKSFLIEVKNSTGIEYNCYKTYNVLVEKLNITLLLFLKNKKLCKLSDVVFNTPNYDPVSKLTIPFKEGTKFRDPHLLNEEDYRKYIIAYESKGMSTSGNSFAYIDFNNTPFYDLGILLKYKKTA